MKPTATISRPRDRQTGLRAIEESTPMAELFAIYQQPKDPAAFDSCYFITHVPLAKTLPGGRSYEVTRGDVMGMGGKHGVYLGGRSGIRFDGSHRIGRGLAAGAGDGR